MATEENPEQKNHRRMIKRQKSEAFRCWLGCIVSYKLTGLIEYQIPSGTVPLLGDVQLVIDFDANRDTQHRR